MFLYSNDLINAAHANGTSLLNEEILRLKKSMRAEAAIARARVLKEEYRANQQSALDLIQTKKV